MKSAQDIASQFDHIYSVGNERKFWLHAQMRFWNEHVLPITGWDAGKWIADLGCGTGFFCNLAAMYGINVIGIDVSVKAIEEARRLRQRIPPQLDFVRFVCCDIAHWLPMYQLHGLYANDLTLFQQPLTGELRQQVLRLAKYVYDGGWLVVRVTTDFSGNSDSGGVVNHKLSDLKDFFSSIGTVDVMIGDHGVAAADNNFNVFVRL